MARTVTDMAYLLNSIAVPDPEDADNLSMWLYNQYPEAVGRDYTQALQRGALRGARLGVVRTYFGGDPEVDALAEAAIQKMRELGAEIVDGVELDPEIATTFQEVRRIADYRFRGDWEEYLATFGPEVPKTVQEFVDIYDNEVAHSALPAAANVVNLLRTSLTTSPDDPVHINLIENTLPTHLAMKLAVFDTHGVDALVFPYSPTFASPINNPVYVAEDPSYVSSTVPSPATVAGYGSMGLPGIVVPMGFGTAGLPGAISFMGRPMDEPKIIGYAYDYEQATMHRKPSPLVPPLPNETITY
jgi:amidase